MNISKKQFKFISLLEKCGYLCRKEINKQEYPDSMIDALIYKKLIFEHEGAVASTTSKDI
jgi:hypothetical protein